MTVKKQYSIGDTVWIYGVSNGKSTEGKVVQTFTVDQDGWDPDQVHYVIAIPTEIEYLLEVRTWETISETKDGHVGGMREAFKNPDAGIRLMRRTGVDLTSEGEFEEPEQPEEDDDISPEAIHAALEKSQKDASHQPLVIKENKARRRYPSRKKKPNAN